MIANRIIIAALVLILAPAAMALGKEPDVRVGMALVCDEAKIEVRAFLFHLQSSFPMLHIP
ncbi:MAG: hypothetical protein OXC57_05395 [Rhodobacteraceae bacterium]|nr:hypothetical protein [Paracoccaceae bacterium]